MYRDVGLCFAAGIITFHEFVRVHFIDNLGEMAEEEDDIDFDHADAIRWAELEKKKQDYERIVFPNIWDEIDPDEPDQVVPQPKYDPREHQEYVGDVLHDEF